jgi:hypothetical protein
MYEPEYVSQFCGSSAAPIKRWGDTCAGTVEGTSHATKSERITRCVLFI